MKKNTASIHEHAPVVQQLQKLLAKQPKMEAALLASLKIAAYRAKTELDNALYHGINDEFQGNGWPTTIENYYNYLDSYVRLVPNESIDPNYPNAWRSTGDKNGYNQKVYDLLCQFYWLVDQPDPKSKKTMQSFEKFAAWLVDFAVAWGAFLDTTDSLTKESLRSFKFNPMYNYPLYADNEKSWTTFNQFFYREFNQANKKTGISPVRPIAAPKDNNIITAPADCTFKAIYPIDKKGNVLESTGDKAKITLKHTHTIGTVQELLNNSKYADDFNEGTFVHYFLGPFDYHRFHTPIAGKVLEVADISGKVYLDVNMVDGQFDAPDNAENGYEFNQARGLVIVDGGKKVGKIAILPIGMAQVSGVEMYTKLQGKKVIKGQEFGRFKFGGSDIIMLFQKNPNLYLFQNDPGHIPIHFQYGQVAAYWEIE